MEKAAGCDVVLAGNVMAAVIFLTAEEQLLSSFTETVALTGSDLVGRVKLRWTTLFGRETVMTVGIVLTTSAEKRHTFVKYWGPANVACNAMTQCVTL